MNADKKRMFQEYVDPEGVLKSTDDAQEIYDSLKSVWDDIEWTVEDLEEYLETLA